MTPGIEQVKIGVLIVLTHKLLFYWTRETMSRHGSLTYQVTQTLQSKLTPGESRFADKRTIDADGRRVSDSKIYSYDTFRTYQKHCNYFAAWAKEQHGCKTLDEARSHAGEWLQSRIDEGLSPYTIKMEASAIAKLYGCSTKDFGIKTPERSRADITRSRGEKAMDKHFSESRNAELVSFCRCTGLRREELQRVSGANLINHGDGSYSLAISGKGGRERIAPIIGTETQVRQVVDRLQAHPDTPAWGKVHAAADIHAYRAEYATAIYNANARDVSTLDRSERYDCRGDKAGISYDREALHMASEALGHSRVSVVAEHYLR